MNLRTSTGTGERDAAADLHVAQRRDGTIEVAGDIDATTSEILDRALRWHERTRRHEGDAPLVIDMSAVRFVDSSGLRTLVAASLRAGDRGSRIALRHASTDLARLLEITGLSEQLGVAPTEGANAFEGVNEAERRYGPDESPS